MTEPRSLCRALCGAAVVALGLAAGSPARATTLDSFTDGYANLQVPAMPLGSDGWLRADTAASVAGGFRSLALQPRAGSTVLSFIEVGATGLLAYRLPNQQLYVSFGYGQTAPMNLDLSGEAALRLDVPWGGVQMGAGWDRDGLTLTVYATTSNGAGLDPNGSAAQAVLRGASIVDLPLSSFFTNASTGVPVNWADVDSLLFVVSENVVGGDTAGFGIRSLSTVSAVPEPGAWALLAAGLLLVGRRRIAAR